MLETTDMIAHLVGYDDPAFFRRLFNRMTGYRQRYRYVGMAEAVGSGSRTATA